MRDFSIYRITLDNGVWYDVKSDIREADKFIKHVYDSDIQMFSITGKGTPIRYTDNVAFPVKKICSIEWLGVADDK